MRIPYTLLRKIIMPLADRAMGTSICKYWEMIPKMNQWSESEIHQWQSDRFKELVIDAYENAIYYRKLMDKMDLSPNDIRSIDDVKLFPVLTKELIKQNFSDIVSKKSSNIKHKVSRTGGSTGDPLQYIQSHEAWSFANADTIVNWEKTGYKYGDAYLALGSSSIMVDKHQSLKHRIYYKMKNKHGLSGINLTDEVLTDYLNFIKQSKIHYVYGYASSIYLLAKHAKRIKWSGDIKCCFPTAELLTTEYYNTIKSVFKCDIMNGYGASDGSVTAFSLNKESFQVGYNSYINPYYNDDQNLDLALLTDLFSCVFPLINYQIGDRVILDSDIKEYNGQVIKTLLGRTSDIIELDNGSRITGPGFTILFSNMPVEYYCLEKMSGSEIVCHIIKGKDYNQAHEDYILKSVVNQTGAGVKVSMRYILEPILAKSGKRVYVLDGSSK